MDLGQLEISWSRRWGNAVPVYAGLQLSQSWQGGQVMPAHCYKAMWCPVPAPSPLDVSSPPPCPHTGSQAGMVRQGCSWPACLTQVWGVQVLQGSWSSTSPPNPIPYLSRGTAGGCGASYGESTGEGGARAETGLPKAPPYPGHCARPILQQHSLPPTWLEAEPSTNWSFVSCWLCSKIISA